RPARAVLGARQVGGQIAVAHDVGQADHPPHRDGGRSRRTVGSLRRLARRGARAGVRLPRSGRWVTISLRTADGLVLAGEVSAPAGARATAVLCHPHPEYGGTMRSIVTSALFEALPEHGIACLRFNFRGVENSEGEHSKGTDEPLDVVAALDAAASRS